MRTMVFDVPAESGGALSVLNDFYNEFKSDLNNDYIFVVSKPDLIETRNIHIIKVPWIKKSWFHRLYFDHFVAPKLVLEHKVDSVLSLQNIIIPHIKIHQSVFVHNALPFSEYRFSFSESKILWIYQNILSKFIFMSIKKADRVIVQTMWMKKKCIEKLNIDDLKIEVMEPKIVIDIKKLFCNSKDSQRTFFYPASGVLFKNHEIIIKACIRLGELGIKNYKVIFTLNGDENDKVLEMANKVKTYSLPIEFIGNITRDEVYEYYSKTVLIFASFIETVGLPLLEARLHETPIIVSDCDYSKEILHGYSKVSYFNPHNYEELANELNEKIQGSTQEYYKR